MNDETTMTNAIKEARARLSDAKASLQSAFDVLRDAEMPEHAGTQDSEWMLQIGRAQESIEELDTGFDDFLTVDEVPTR